MNEWAIGDAFESSNYPEHTTIITAITDEGISWLSHHHSPFLIDTPSTKPVPIREFAQIIQQDHWHYVGNIDPSTLPPKNRGAF